MVSSSRQAIAHIVCILLLLSTAVSAQSQTAADKSQTGSISGRVTLKGKGISGITVGLLQREVSSAHITRLRAVTDDEGKYRITNVPPSGYEVIVSAPLYVADTQKSVIISKNEAVEDIDFTLVRGGVITGRVTDSEGHPVAEEEVNFTLRGADQGRPYMRTIRTDDRGIYRAFGVPAGRYKVFAGKDEREGFGDPWERSGYKRTFHPDVVDESQATVIEVTEGSEATNVDITLSRVLLRYSAQGRVIDGETGKPVVNVRYGVQMFGDQNYTSSRTTGAVSGKNGEFRITNLTPGRYAVFVEPPTDSDWQAEAVRFEVNDQDVEGLIVKTAKGSTITGLVVLEGSDDKTVRPNMTNGRIHAYVSGQNMRGNPSATLNPDGSFRLNGLAAGTVTFWVTTTERLRVLRVERDGVSYPRSIEIKPEEQVTGLRVIATYANASIRGVLKMANGLPPPSARFHVSLRRVGDDPLYPTSVDAVQVDARGQFVAEGLLAGTYEVIAGLQTNDWPPKILGVTQQLVEVTSGGVTNVTITLQQPSVPNRP